MLKISAQSEYALILVRYLIKNKELKTISEIAINISIKEPILRKIVNKLERKGILKSVKGRKGGIIINDLEISVYDILESMDEDLHVTLCSDKICNKSQNCEIGPVMENLQRGLDTVLKITKL